MSLKWRLASALLALLLLLGVTIALAGRYSAQLYFQEVNQELNASVAMYVVERLALIEDGAVNEAAMMSLAQQAMTVNPSVEVYLLDPDGRIAAHVLPQEAVLREQVDLGPVQTFLTRSGNSPVMGDDPRALEGRKVFSASPIMHGETLQGYLYVILGGQLFDAVQENFLGTFIGRVTAAGLFVVLLVGGVVGVYVLMRLTRPLERLETALGGYTESGFTAVQALQDVPEHSREVSNLKRATLELAAKLAQQFEQLKTNDRLRRELLANISHDLRTPLASMQGYVETLLIKDQQLDAEQRRRYLATAHRHTQQLSGMVADLFELAKLDAGAVQPRIEPFSLSELLQDVIAEFRLVADGADVKLTLAGDLQHQVVVQGDISLIQRVFENLISNALRYTPAGGSVEVGVTTMDPAQGRVRVGVTDTGCGIPAEQLPTLFDRYSRQDQSDMAHAGLGLAIVKRILELHDSEIRVTSTIDQGTSFSFELAA